MSILHDYALEALASAGFAVLDTRVAAEMRPDLWRSGQIATLGQRAANERAALLAQLSRVSVTTAHLEGIEGPVEIIYRSKLRLAERVEEVLGRACRLIEPKPAAAATEPREQRHSQWAHRRAQAAPDPPQV